ncbi:MAG: META domain-containing protein [Pseudomonadota bacterium]
MLPRLMLSALLACVPVQAATLDRIAGSVRSAERITLPADALLTVELIEAPRPDGLSGAGRLARLTLPTHGRQMPLAFELPFYPDDVDPAGRYVLRATLVGSGGEVLYATRDPSPVLTRGAGMRADVALQSVRDAVPAATLENTYWKLVEVAGQAARALPGEREAHMLLLAGRASGNSGCNKLMGTYVLGSQGSLSMGPLASTRMACPARMMAQEAALLDAFARTTAYRIGGRTLSLTHGEVVLARFHARHFE